MKTCTKCHTSKEESEFIRKTKANSSICNKCNNAYQAAWQKRNRNKPEKVSEAGFDYNHAMRHRIRDGVYTGDLGILGHFGATDRYTEPQRGYAEGGLPVDKLGNKYSQLR